MAFKKKARRKEIKNTLSYDVNESNIVPLVIKNAVLVDKSGYKCFFKRLIYIGCPKLRIPAIPDTDTVLIRTVFSFCFLCSYFYFNCPVCSSFLIDSPLNSIR